MARVFLPAQETIGALSVLRVRVAEGRDVETLFELRTSVRENHLSRAQLAELGITAEHVAARLESDACAWLAELDGEPAGFAMALAPERSLFALFVRPGSEGRGVGSALLRRAETWLFAGGAETIELTTAAEPQFRAHGFYRRMGWEAAGTSADGQTIYRKRRTNAATRFARSWDVLLLGGASGAGKSSVGYALAQAAGAAMCEVDDLHIALQRLTTPEQLPLLHYWRTHPEAAEWPAPRIVELQIAVGEWLSDAVAGVVANHLETARPVVLEGDYLVPSLAARLCAGDGRVRAVFLHEPERAQLVANYRAREPAVGEQHERAEVSRLYGEWLVAEAKRLGLVALSARPWHTALERIGLTVDG